MKNLKLNLMANRYRYVTALLVIVSMAVFILRPDLLASSKTDPTHKRKYNGEKILRGLLFGEDGPVSEMFPQIWKDPQVLEQKKSGKRLKAWNDFKERIIGELKARDHTFLDRFGVAMQSGDHIKIVDGLNEAGRLMRESLENAEAAAKAARKDRGQSASRNGSATKGGGARFTKTSMPVGGARPQDGTTTCEYGICVTEDSYGITVFEDAANPQDVTANACSAVAVCALALLVAVWKWAVLVDVAAVVFVAAVVVATWRWKYTYNRMEVADTEALFQEMLVDDIAQNLYLLD